MLKEIIKNTKIKDLEVLRLDTFHDYRGEIWTVYSEEYCDTKFVADKISISNYGVLRGFHGDSNTAKLITCLSGQFQLCVADARRESKTYGNTETFFLDAQTPTVIFVPAGCINAHLSLSKECIFYYKWSEAYQGPEAQVTVAWNDPDLNFEWAVQNPILSERDRAGLRFKDVKLQCLED